MNDATALPPNIQEFNEIVAVIFAQLYLSHPLEKTLDPTEIAKTIGVVSTLPSGRPFYEVFESTIRWLRREGYINAHGNDPRERATLTGRAFQAMNAVPPVLKTLQDAVPSLPQSANTGTLLVAATSSGHTKQTGSIISNIFGWKEE